MKMPYVFRSVEKNLDTNPPQLVTNVGVPCQLEIAYHSQSSCGIHPLERFGAGWRSGVISCVTGRSEVPAAWLFAFWFNVLAQTRLPVG
jgi:hypothetical protein